ncbi:AMP-binding enzyme [Colletotrichum scovillei]|uniref:AMP-binding enzyme n=1 Tax=Colletotrichum scovillei TaxID=1209932 RepID=A0A9P7R387_9PEZI|nr:AMP-binding enzyme [Colletotrichum scovillei]KAG7060170.1 AMP-binding enzyme [Colletotrichum scovillei]KAG7067622.1 AMP-binding enzyme [Colletotrichum scovillei]
MHLRDSEGGGTAYQETGLTDGATNGLTNGNSTVNPSSTRTVVVTSRAESTAGVSDFRHELLLAWLLVLHRNNDDGLSKVNWGFRTRDDQEPSSATHNSLSLSEAPFKNSDSIAEALEVIKELGESGLESETQTIPVIYFNNGAPRSQGNSEKAPSKRSQDWTYQIEATLNENQLVIKAQWDRAVLSYRHAIFQLDSFIEILTTILEKPYRQVSDTIGPTAKDLEQLWTWNAELPENMQKCMQDIISEVAAKGPERPAVESWDGNFSYGDVDRLSTRLARHLVARGVTVGSTVPMCFEKSRWTTVALLAVMKAGAAFALTDPSQPEARLRTIVEQTGATVIVTSQNQSDLGRRIAPEQTLVIASDDTLNNDTLELAAELPVVPPSSPLYIQFTSGSTGKPKGVMISHENFTSGAVPRGWEVGYRAHSRCFDFASYAFDVSIDCMLCTLAAGGCLCIASDEDRMNDLSGAIRNSKCNMAHMTPSVARVLDADVIPSLEVLGLGGEAVSAGDASTWSKTTSVIIAYGPSECTVGCTINGNVSSTSTNIGKGTGGLTWIVDPDDHERLMPVGAVGELLIEGPVVGMGYLNDKAKTDEVFIEDPAWLLAGGGPARGRHGRLYKTGDLVRYDPDGTGSIAFVGRKDQQVKLRGQRIELAEVEHHLRGKMPSGVKIVAEVIKPGGSEPTLVAFVVEQNPVDGPVDAEAGDVTTFSPEFSQAIAEIDIALGAEIPRYMVPSAYIPLRKMPSLVSGKIDRKRLRELGGSMSREQVARLRVAPTEKSEPETEMEKALQQVWIKILGSESAAAIGLHDSFFALGGDSLRAMKLVAAAREDGIALTVATIFNFPTLKAMAENATKVSKEDDAAVTPFSLLEEGWTPEEARAESAKLCGIDESAIEDIYPCTPLQEGLMALSAKVTSAYVAQRVVDLADAATADKLRNAFDVAAADCAILRTRIVQVPGRGLAQVVVKEDIAWHIGDDLQGYLVKDREEGMDLGRPLVRYALVTDNESGKVQFVLTMHHALYDGWCMPLIVDKVNKAFDGQKVQRPAEFKDFIKYLGSMDRSAAETYWREQLQGAAATTQFPALPYEGYQTQADSLLEVYVPLNGRPASNTTVATVIRGAWAYVASHYASSNDVIFGETLTGRNAPIRGSDEIEGPMITTVPFRTQVNAETLVSDYLQDIQDQTIQQIPYEHTGLQHIRRLSPDALEACELRTGLVLHPSADDFDQEEFNKYPANRLVPAGDAEAAEEALKFNTYALMLVCSTDPKGFLVMASFDSKTVQKPLMEKALAQFSQVAQKLCQLTDTPLGDIAYLTEEDKTEVARLSTESAKSVQQEYPEAEAVYIVNPTDSALLAPLGVVGELVVVSKSDLSLSTLENPSWAENKEAGKFYKTERLAKFNADGSVEITGKTSDLVQKASTATKAPTKRISATSAKQRRLRTLWSRVLRLPESDIGLNDSFFRLGGDSIGAMKLVSEARLAGLTLTVNQVFTKRTLYDMASVLQDSEPTQDSQESLKPLIPFELVENLGDAPAETLRPLLADPTWKIVDAFPARPLQEVAVKGTIEIPRFSARYEAMYFESDVDRPRLFQSCQELVSLNEVLRSVFVKHNGACLSVILEDVKTPVVEYEIDSDVETFVKDLCNMDVQTRMPLGSIFVKWFFVHSSNGQSALVFRVSHAQYDEICLPIMLHQLSALHEGKPVPKALPFSSFVGHVVKSNIPQSVDYWKELLQGSSVNVLKPDTPVTERQHYAIDRTFDISTRSKDVTIATLPTAAWALTLARLQSTRDVTFGEVVSGRNIDFPNADMVVGPCWQYVPVRVKFEDDWTVLDLLNLVQNQHIASSAHEGIGLPEIAKLCTDWPASVDWFDTVVHQDVEHVESLGFETASSRMETIYPQQEPLREWKIQAFPQGDKLTIEIVTFESWKGHAAELLDKIEETFKILLGNPRSLLFEQHSHHSLISPRRFNAPPATYQNTNVTMSDNVTWTSDFDKFLAELDTENYANDNSFMDLLDPTGCYDFGHVDDGALGAADPLDPANETTHQRSPDDGNDLTFSMASARAQNDSKSLEIASATSVERTAAGAQSACAQCGEHFDSVGWLLHHAQIKNHRILLCPVQGCGKLFRSFNERYDHQRLPHLEGHERVETEHPFACVECSVEFKNKSRLQEHANEAQHNPFACSCGKNFARLDVLARHLDSMGTDLPKYPCHFCKSHRGENGFRRRDHLLQHVRGYHKFEAEGKIENIIPSRRGKYQTPPVCHFADCLHYRDDNFETLSREEQNRSKPFESQSEYTKHMKNAHDFTHYPCTVRGCSKIGAKGYAREKDLIKHRKKDHPEAGTYVPATRDTKITCPKPEEWRTEIRALRMHAQWRHHSFDLSYLHSVC